MKDNDPKYTSDIAFTPAVKAMQTKYRSRKSYERMEQSGGWQSEINPQLEQFLSTMDSFYLGTSNTQGQPYIQHRGGPKGFLKVLDANRLAFADFSGNRQYISTGNLTENNRAFIFLMDYPNRTRVKLWGKAHTVEDDEKLLESLADISYKAKVERAIIFTLEAWDINCPQHIQQRFTPEDMAKVVDPLRKRIAELEEIIKKAK
ncbi:pyridoxamine 5'-phosphate oxidase family protein [Spongiimicrobium sp. 3-5]|uniref:pyridoxamine 5'-phosphate oxidase family protein n=1 Tax=Spongiimicrobium sp. 3-5 TaxID=3332596 RepID=UPI00397E9215